MRHALKNSGLSKKYSSFLINGRSQAKSWPGSQTQQCDSNKTYLQGLKHSNLLPSRLDIHSDTFKGEKVWKVIVKKVCNNLLHSVPLSKLKGFFLENRQVKIFPPNWSRVNNCENHTQVKIFTFVINFTWLLQIQRSREIERIGFTTPVTQGLIFFFFPGLHVNSNHEH